MLLNLLFPPRCVFCREFLGKYKVRGICPDCSNTLPFCEGVDARQAGEFFSVCVSPLYYVDMVRESHHRYKFQGSKWYARTYAPLVAQCITEHYAGRYDLITWVPLSRKRRRKRGYDQAELLARSIGTAFGTEAVGTMQKVRDTAPLSSLGGRDERKANIAKAYAPLDEATIVGKRILLIDDIVTTGSSLSECARCLLMAGAEEVLCATLARAEV